MGMDPEGILAYGYDLGGEEHSWHIEEYDKNEYKLRVPWYDPEDDAEQFGEQAWDQLVKAITGFDEVWTADSGFFDRRREAEEMTKTDWGACLVSPDLDHSAAGRLDKALKILGLTPTPKDPGWILACFYG